MEYMKTVGIKERLNVRCGTCFAKPKFCNMNSMQLKNEKPFNGK